MATSQQAGLSSYASREANLARIHRNPLPLELSSIFTATPRRLVRRLAPPQITLLLSAVSFASATARKLMPEASEEEQRRPRLVP